MKKLICLIILTILLTQHSIAQKLGDYYIPVSNDSLEGPRLKFLNDSMIELSNRPRHMSPLLTEVHQYTVTDSVILILPNATNTAKSNLKGLYLKDFAFKTSMRLIKIEGGFIDYDDSLIYVRQKDFDQNPDVTFIIDGKPFIQDMGESDGYGSLRKNQKTNRALNRRFKKINKENCTVEIVKGLNAYKRFGIEKVFGVVIITSK